MKKIWRMWNTGAHKRCMGCKEPLTRDELTMCIYGRGAYHIRCDPTRRVGEVADDESSTDGKPLTPAS